MARQCAIVSKCSWRGQVRVFALSPLALEVFSRELFGFCNSGLEFEVGHWRFTPYSSAILRMVLAA
jgi:hypothetical protein